MIGFTWQFLLVSIVVLSLLASLAYFVPWMTGIVVAVAFYGGLNLSHAVWKSTLAKGIVIQVQEQLDREQSGGYL